jgi:hypothetical protein
MKLLENTPKRRTDDKKAEGSDTSAGLLQDNKKDDGLAGLIPGGDSPSIVQQLLEKAVQKGLDKLHARHRHDGQEANTLQSQNARTTPIKSASAGTTTSNSSHAHLEPQFVQSVTQKKKKKERGGGIAAQIIDQVEAAASRAAGIRLDGEDVVVAENANAAENASGMNRSAAAARLREAADAQTGTEAKLGNSGQSAAENKGQEQGPSKSLDLDVQKIDPETPHALSEDQREALKDLFAATGNPGMMSMHISVAVQGNQPIADKHIASFFAMRSEAIASELGSLLGKASFTDADRARIAELQTKQSKLLEAQEKYFTQQTAISDFLKQHAREVQQEAQTRVLLRETESFGRAARRANGIVGPTDSAVVKAEQDRFEAFKLRNGELLSRNSAVRAEMDKVFDASFKSMDADIADAARRAQNIWIAADGGGTNSDLLWKNLRADNGSTECSDDDWAKGYGPNSVYHTKEKLELIQQILKHHSGGESLQSVCEGEFSFGTEEAALAVATKAKPNAEPGDYTANAQKIFSRESFDNAFAKLSATQQPAVVAQLRATKDAANPAIALRELSTEVGSENLGTALADYSEVYNEDYVASLTRTRAGEGVTVVQGNKAEVRGDVPTIAQNYLATGTLSESEVTASVSSTRGKLLSEAAAARNLAERGYGDELLQHAAQRDLDLQRMYESLEGDPHAGLAKLPTLFKEGSAELKVRSDTDIQHDLRQSMLAEEYARLYLKQRVLAHQAIQAKEYKGPQQVGLEKKAAEAAQISQAFLAKHSVESVGDIHLAVNSQLTQDFQQAEKVARDIYENEKAATCKEALRQLSPGAREILAGVYEARYLRADQSFIQEALSNHSESDFNNADGMEASGIEFTEVLALYSGNEALAERAAIARGAKGVGSGDALQRLTAQAERFAKQAEQELGRLPTNATLEQKDEWYTKVQLRAKELMKQFDKEFTSEFGDVVGYASLKDLNEGEFWDSFSDALQAKSALEGDRDGIVRAKISGEFGDDYAIFDADGSAIAKHLATVIDANGEIDVARMKRIDRSGWLRDSLVNGTKIDADAPGTKWALSLLSGDRVTANAHMYEWSMRGAGTEDEELRAALLPEELQQEIAALDRMDPQSRALVEAKIKKHVEDLRLSVRKHESLYLGGAGAGEDYSKFVNRMKEDLDSRYEAPVIARLLKEGKLETIDLVDFAFKGDWDGTETDNSLALLESVSGEKMLNMRVDYALRTYTQRNTNASPEQMKQERARILKEDIPNFRDPLVQRAKDELSGDSLKRAMLAFESTATVYDAALTPEENLKNLKRYASSIEDAAQSGLVSWTSGFTKEDTAYENRDTELKAAMSKLETAVKEKQAAPAIQAQFQQASTQATQAHDQMLSYRMAHDAVVDLVAETASTTIVVIGGVALAIPSGGTSVATATTIIGVGAAARPLIKMAGRGDVAYEGVGQDIAMSAVDVAMVPVGCWANMAARKVLLSRGLGVALRNSRPVSVMASTKIGSWAVNGGSYVLREGVSGAVDGAVVGGLMGISHTAMDPSSYNGNVSDFVAKTGEATLSGMATYAQVGFGSGITMPIVGAGFRATGRGIKGSYNLVRHGAWQGRAAKSGGPAQYVDAAEPMGAHEFAPVNDYAVRPRLVQQTGTPTDHIHRAPETFTMTSGGNNAASTTRIHMPSGPDVAVRTARPENAGSPSSAQHNAQTNRSRPQELHPELTPDDIAQALRNLHDEPDIHANAADDVDVDAELAHLFGTSDISAAPVDAPVVRSEAPAFTQENGLPLNSRSNSRRTAQNDEPHGLSDADYDPVADYQRRLNEEGDSPDFGSDWGGGGDYGNGNGGGSFGGGGGGTAVATRPAQSVVQPATQAPRVTPSTQTPQPAVSNSLASAETGPVHMSFDAAPAPIAQQPVTDYSVQAPSSTSSASRPNQGFVSRTAQAARMAMAMSTAQPGPIAASGLHTAHAPQVVQSSQVITPAAPANPVRQAVVRTDFHTTVGGNPGAKTTPGAPKPATHTETAPQRFDAPTTDYALRSPAQVAATHAVTTATAQAVMHEEDTETATKTSAKTRTRSKVKTKARAKHYEEGGSAVPQETEHPVLEDDDFLVSTPEASDSMHLIEDSEPELERQIAEKAFDDHLSRILDETGMGDGSARHRRWKQTEAS